MTSFSLRHLIPPAVTSPSPGQTQRCLVEATSFQVKAIKFSCGILGPYCLPGWGWHRSEEDRSYHSVSHSNLSQRGAQIRGSLLLLSAICERVCWYRSPSPSCGIWEGLSVDRWLWDCLQNFERGTHFPSHIVQSSWRWYLYSEYSCQWWRSWCYSFSDAGWRGTYDWLFQHGS